MVTKELEKSAQHRFERVIGYLSQEDADAVRLCLELGAHRNREAGRLEGRFESGLTVFFGLVGGIGVAGLIIGGVIALNNAEGLNQCNAQLEAAKADCFDAISVECRPAGLP